jgi:hypothetical protein
MRYFPDKQPLLCACFPIDYCLRLLKDRGKELFADYEVRLKSFYGKAKQLKNLRVFSADGLPDCVYRFDPGKLLILTGAAGNLSGAKLAGLLREKHNIETEYALNEAVLA